MFEFSQKYWRYSCFYFLYFLSIGALVPYWSVYLKDLSFSAIEIGQLISVLGFTKIIAPFLWGWLADKTGLHIRIVKITSILACLCFLPLVWFNSYWLLMTFMVLFSFFWNAALPQFEVVTLRVIADDLEKYSHIRLWGSIGFIVAVFLMASIIKQYSIQILPAILTAIMLLIVISSFNIKEERTRHYDVGSVVPILKQKKVIALFLACFLLQLSHGPYHTFFTLYMQGYGYDLGLISSFWSLGVFAEVVLFLFMHRLLKQREASFYMFLALFVTGIRWILLAQFSQYLWVVLFSQTLHAASFGLFHASGIHMVHQYFPKHEGQGQAIYASVSFGAGGAIGSLMSGYLWDFTSPEFTFLLAGTLVLMGAFIYKSLMSNTQKRQMKQSHH